MPTLATGGFPVSVMPRSPEFPSQLGVVNSVDPDKIYADVKRGLETADALAMNQQRLAAEQAQLGFAQDQAKTQRTLLAGGAQRTAAENEAGTQRALLSQGVQPGAAASQIQQNTLAGAQAARATSLLGPEVTQTHTVQNPDGTFTTVSAKTSNAVPVESSTATTPFVSGKPSALDSEVAMLPPEDRARARQIAAGLAPKAAANQVVRYQDQTGATHVGVIDKLTGKLRDATADDFADQNAGPVVGVGASTTQAAANKLTAQRAAELPTAIFKARNNEINQQNFSKQIDDAIAHISPLATKYGQNLANIKGTDANILNSYLTPLKGEEFFNNVQAMKNQSGQTGVGRILQSEVPFITSFRQNIDPAIGGVELIRNLQRLRNIANLSHQAEHDQFNQTYGPLLNAVPPEQRLPWMVAPEAPSATATPPAPGQSAPLQAAASSPPVLTPEQAKTSPSGDYQTTDGRPFTISR